MDAGPDTATNAAPCGSHAPHRTDDAQSISRASLSADIARLITLTNRLADALTKLASPALAFEWRDQAIEDAQRVLAEWRGAVEDFAHIVDGLGLEPRDLDAEGA
jgi:hypothetical protein